MVGILPGYEGNNRVYSWGGCCPCIRARDFKDPKKILVIDDDGNYSDRQNGQHDRQHS